VDPDVEADVVVEPGALTTKAAPLVALGAVFVGSEVDVLLDESIVKLIPTLRQGTKPYEAKQLTCHRLRIPDDIEIA